MNQPATTKPLVVIRGPADSPLCHQCPFAHDGKPVQPVRGVGPEDPLFIIVGEGPGGHERESGYPFVGLSGQLLNKALRVVGVDRERAYVTNAILCTPPGATDQAKRIARECCAPRLDSELAMFPAAVPVSALGAIAAQRLISDKMTIREMAGATYDLPTGRIVIPTTHPAAILRGSETGEDQEGSAHRGDLAFWNLAYDIGKVVRLAEGRLIRFSEDVDIEWKDKDRANELVVQICHEIILERLGGLDTETDSLRPLLATVTAIGLATRKRAVSVAWHLVDLRGRAAIQSVLTRPWVKLSVHNWLYDLTVIRKLGFEVACELFDSLLAHHSAFPGLAHDLQRVLTQFFVCHAWKSEFRGGKKTKELFEAIQDTSPDLGDDEVEKRWYALLRYCALDTLAAVRLIRPLEECLTRFDAWASYREDMAQVPIANEMHENGVPLDLERNSEMGKFFELRLEIAKAQFEAKANDPSLRSKFLDYLAMEQAKQWRKGTGDKTGRSKANRAPDPPDYLSRWSIRLLELKAREDTKLRTKLKINQPMHIVAYLKARGVPLYIETKKGRLSAGEKALRPLRHMPEVTALMAYRENKTELGTFIVGVRKALYPDGRFHPRWSIHKITGRWGAEDPASQNWSKGKPRWVCVHCGRLEKDHGPKTEMNLLLCPDVLGKPEWPDGLYMNEWRRPLEPTTFKKEKGSYENWKKKWLLLDASVHASGLQKAGIPNLRWQVVAPPGTVLVGFDMAQLEWRLIGLVSGDPWLINIFANDKDIHSEFAVIVWADFYKQQVDIRKRLRDFIKRTGYGAAYGGSVNTLWQNLLKDDPQVKRQDVAKVVAIIQKQLAGVMAWHQRLLKQVMLSPHEIRSLFGRRFVFPLGTCSPNDVYNATIQSAGAGIMARGLQRLTQAMAVDPGKWNGVEKNIQIHDACMFICPKEIADEFCALVKSSFEQKHTHNGMTVDFPADARTAEDWAGL